MGSYAGHLHDQLRQAEARIAALEAEVERSNRGWIQAVQELYRKTPDAERFAFVVAYNWIGAKTRCEHGIQDGDIHSARAAIDAALTRSQP